MKHTTYTTAFKKDYKRVKKQRKKLHIINDIIFKLSHNIPLNKKQKDHVLIGDYKNKRECHLESDWLLIYEFNNDHLILHRTGSHSELFKK